MMAAVSSLSTADIAPACVDAGSIAIVSQQLMIVNYIQYLVAGTRYIGSTGTSNNARGQSAKPRQKNNVILTERQSKR